MKAMKLMKALNDIDEDLIEQAAVPNTQSGHKKIRRYLMLAAVIGAMTALITACTVMGGGELVLQYFSQAQPGRLSQEQAEYIVANTNDVNISRTENGYILTLQSVFSDGRDILMQFALTAPGDMVLDADSYRDIHGTILEFEKGSPKGMALSWQLRDEDRSDNQAILLCSVESMWNSTDSFTEGNCRLYIYGLEAVWHENLTTRSEILTEGCFSYDIRFPQSCSQCISLVTDPVPVCQTVTVDYVKVGENVLQPVTEQREGEILSLNLWPLSAELSFRFGEEPRNAEFGDITVVMKNGEKIRMTQCFVSPDLISYKVETPILLDQVDYLLLEDGTKFPAP